MTLNKESIKKLYPTKRELNKLISDVESDIYTYEQYNTRDSKLRVQRQKIFLRLLNNLGGEYEKENK